MHKRGESQYVSWVIVLGLTVALSYLLYTWSMSQAEKTSEQLEERANPLSCSEAGISVEGICQTPRSLEINITNTNSLKIEGFIVRTIGLYPEDSDYLDSKTVIEEIDPGDSVKLSILKKSTLSHAEIIPIVSKNEDRKNIYCEEQSVKKEEIKQC